MLPLLILTIADASSATTPENPFIQWHVPLGAILGRKYRNIPRYYKCKKLNAYDYKDYTLNYKDYTLILQRPSIKMRVHSMETMSNYTKRQVESWFI